MVPVGKSRWLWIAAAIVVVVALSGGFVVWRASQALKATKEELRAEREIAFTFRIYVPPQYLAFAPVRSPEVFAQLARLQDRFYIAGPAGLHR